MEKFSIPHISEEKLQELSYIKPVVKDGPKLFYVQDCDLRDQAFTFCEKVKRASSLKEKSRHRTLHTYGYHGFFKPSVAEVLAQIQDQDLNDVVAFQTIGPHDASDLNKSLDELNEGFHVAETILYTKENEKSLGSTPDRIAFYSMDVEDKLDHTIYLVEATHNEQLHFWSAYHDFPNPKHFKEKPIKNWEQGSGNYINIGYFGEHPVVLGLMWDKLDGHWVCFWEPTSRVVDREMIDKWFRLNFPRKTLDGRPATTNASNFMHVISEIKKLNEKDN